MKAKKVGTFFFFSAAEKFFPPAFFHFSPAFFRRFRTAGGVAPFRYRSGSLLYPAPFVKKQDNLPRNVKMVQDVQSLPRCVVSFSVRMTFSGHFCRIFSIFGSWTLFSLGCASLMLFNYVPLQRNENRCNMRIVKGICMMHDSWKIGGRPVMNMPAGLRNVSYFLTLVNNQPVLQGAFPAFGNGCAAGQWKSKCLCHSLLCCSLS